MTDQALTPYTDFTPIVALVTDSMTSTHSKRAYERNLTDFLTWHDGQGRPGLTKATVNHYRAHLLERGLSSATINQTLSAVRKLAAEAADNGMMDPAAAEGIARVKGIKQDGHRAGNWLTKEQAEALLNSTDVETLKGKRDRALLGVMLGGGLRRSEVVALTVDHIQMRDARWVIVDLIGKRGRIRTIPIPAWAKRAVDEWTTAAGITEGHIFRAMNRHSQLIGDTMTAQAVYDVVDQYATATGFGIAAHDLRRTFAKLAHKGGAGLDQIQLTLGHASIQTTERYLGVDQNLTNAPCDVLGLALYR